MIKQTGTKPK